MGAGGNATDAAVNTAGGALTGNPLQLGQGLLQGTSLAENTFLRVTQQATQINNDAIRAIVANQQNNYVQSRTLRGWEGETDNSYMAALTFLNDAFIPPEGSTEAPLFSIVDLDETPGADTSEAVFVRQNGRIQQMNFPPYDRLTDTQRDAVNDIFDIDPTDPDDVAFYAQVTEFYETLNQDSIELAQEYATSTLIANVVTTYAIQSEEDYRAVGAEIVNDMQNNPFAWMDGNAPIESRVGTSVTTGVGAGIGAVIGQVLIPIPGVGAAIGAGIGGYLGGRAGSYVVSGTVSDIAMTTRASNAAERTTNLAQTLEAALADGLIDPGEQEQLLALYPEIYTVFEMQPGETDLNAAYQRMVSRHMPDATQEVMARRRYEALNSPTSNIEQGIFGQDFFVRFDRTFQDEIEEQDVINTINNGTPEKAAQAARQFIEQRARDLSTEAIDHYTEQLRERTGNPDATFSLGGTDMVNLSKLPDEQARERFAGLIGTPEGQWTEQDEMYFSAIVANGTFQDYGARERLNSYNWRQMYYNYTSSDQGKIDVFNDIQDVQNEGFRGITNLISAWINNFISDLFRGPRDAITGQNENVTIAEDGSRQVLDDDGELVASLSADRLNSILTGTISGIEILDHPEFGLAGINAPHDFDVNNRRHVELAFQFMTVDDMQAILQNNPDFVEFMNAAEPGWVEQFQEIVQLNQLVNEEILAPFGPDGALEQQPLPEMTRDENGIVTIIINGEAVEAYMTQEQFDQLEAIRQSYNEALEAGPEAMREWLRSQERDDLEEIIAEMAAHGIEQSNAANVVVSAVRETDNGITM